MSHEETRTTTKVNHRMNEMIWYWCSQSHLRQWTLAGTAMLGILGAAGFTASLPFHFRAEAQFACKACESTPMVAPAITEQMMSTAYDRLGSAAGTLGDKVTTAVKSETTGTCQLCVTVDAVDPTHAQKLATTLAEMLGEQKAPTAAKPSAPAADAQAATEAFQVADEKYRDALARLGERETKSTDPWVAPAQAAEESTEPSAPMMTTRAIVPASRAAEETLIQTALRECMYRRNNLAELYSEEHPAVIALDRQIQHLERQSAGSEAPASNVDLAGYDEAAADINSAAAVQQLATEVESLKQMRDEAWQAVEQAKMASHVDAFEFAATSPVTLGTTKYVGPDRRWMFLVTTLCILTAAAGVELVISQRLASLKKQES